MWVANNTLFVFYARKRYKPRKWNVDMKYKNRRENVFVQE